MRQSLYNMNASTLRFSPIGSFLAQGDVFTAVNAPYVRNDVTASAGANTGLSEMIFFQVREPSPALCMGLALGVVSLSRRR